MRKWKLEIFVVVASAIAASQADAGVINVAPFGNATQSSTHGDYVADRAIDGSKTGRNADFTHTSHFDTRPAWTLDLTEVQAIESIDIYNRTDCCGGRLRDITVEILDTDASTVLYRSGWLNPGNVLGGGSGDYSLGPPSPWTITPPRTVDGQFVRISRIVYEQGEETFDHRVLALSEVEVFADVMGPVNIALGKAATQTSGFVLYPANHATDGDSDSFTHTAGTDAGASWQVDLDGEYVIDEIVLVNRDDCCGERLRDITVQILDREMNSMFTSALLNPENSLDSPTTLTLDRNDFEGTSVRGSYVKILRTGDPDHSGYPAGNFEDSNVLSLGEVQVYGTLASVPEPSASLLAITAVLSLGIRLNRGLRRK